MNLEFNFQELPQQLDPPPAIVKQRPLNFVKVARHPVGGYTLAVPINQTEGSSRMYHQWFATEGAAEPLMRQHNRDLCKRYKNNPVFADSIAEYEASREAAKTTVKLN